MNGRTSTLYVTGTGFIRFVTTDEVVLDLDPAEEAGTTAAESAEEAGTAATESAQKVTTATATKKTRKTEKTDG